MTASDDIGKELDQLRKDMASLRADLGSLLSVVKDVGVEQGQSAFDRVREGGEMARGQARAAQEEVEHYIGERPVTSVLVALGAGFFIGLLLGHRR